MDADSIHTENAYQAALKMVGSLMAASFGTVEGQCLDLLATLIEANETKHYPMDAPHRDVS